jgi:hypothetical protein
MSLKSVAQFYVVDPMADSPADVANLTLVPLEPLEVSEHDHPIGLPIDKDKESSPPMPHEHESSHELEVGEPGEVEIVIEELPGAPAGTSVPDPELEVHEEPMKVEDQNDPGKPKKDPKWDWEAHGPKGFIAWVKSRCDDVPKHSGMDTAGLERAIAYLDKLDGEISRAMRMDLDGELDANQIEKVRALIDDGVARLNERLDKIKKVKKTKRTKKKSDLEHDQLIKEAQKIMGVSGVVVTADLLTFRVARTCVNSVVSAGHDIEDVYAHQVKEYNLNKREQACVRELLECMGYIIREDRGHFPDDDIDLGSSDNFDFMGNFKG